MPFEGSRFEEVATIVSALDPHRVEQIATIGYGSQSWPLWCVHPASPERSSAPRPYVLVSAGIHGDEEAGVHAALRLLSIELAAGTRAQLVVLPCVNPSGFAAGTVENATGVNLNRVFGTGAREQEVRAIEQWLAHRGCRFAMALDLHEVGPDYVGEGFGADDNPRDPYLYETVTDDSPRIGHAVIAALPPHRRACDWPTIYGDINDRGVIAYPEGGLNPIYAQGTSFDAFLAAHYTRHALTFETPTGWPLEERVETHLRWVTTALAYVT